MDQFYRDNYRIVYGYLLSLCGNPVLAEDLAAETFLKAIQQLDSYDSQYKASTWLCTIGRNLYFNHHKRAKRLLPLSAATACTVPSPEDLYLQKEQAQAAIATARKLPELQRQVVFMRLEGMSFRQIGDALGKNENWARVTYFRAKSVIFTKMEGDIE